MCVWFIFISRMMLFKKSEHDPKLDKCQVDGRNYDLFMFPGQVGSTNERTESMTTDQSKVW